MSATTPDQPEHTNDAGVPPAPPEAHQAAGAGVDLIHDFPWNVETRDVRIDGEGIAANLIEQARTREFADLDAAIHFSANPHADDIVVVRYLARHVIVASAVEELIDAGYTLRLHDGEKWATSETTESEEIVAVLMATGQETLYVRDQDCWEWTGTISLINDECGWEAFGKYDPELTPNLSRAFALADSLREALDRYVYCMC